MNQKNRENNAYSEPDKQPSNRKFTNKNTQSTKLEISIIHQNVQSLGNAIDRIQYFLQSEQHCKVFLVTEHWKTEKQLKVLPINNFNLAANWCRNEKEHGGAAVYVHQSIKFKNKEKLSKFSVKGELECAASVIRINKQEIIVLAVYRPCNGNKEIFLKLLEKLITSIQNENKLIILGGDFNIELTRDNKYKTELLSLLDSFGIYKHIKDDTRVTNNTNSCIDNIFSNIESRTECSVSSYVISNHVSDHKAQKICFNLKTNKKTINNNVRIYKEEAIQEFFNDLREQTWSLVYSLENSKVDEQWNCFLNAFLGLFNIHFPKRPMKNKFKTNKFYNNPELVTCKQSLDLLLMLSNSNPNFKNMYKNQKKKYDEILIQTRKENYNKKIISSDNKNKAMWTVCNEIKGNSKKNSDCMIPGSPDTIANDYNKYLINLIPNLFKTNTVAADFNCNNISNNATFYLRPLTPDDIINLSKKLKNKFSSGMDEIPVTIVKRSTPLIKSVICYIINNSFKHGIFPTQLKLSLIKPLFKKGDPENLESYRPISLLNSFSKLFELAMSTQILKYFHECNLFSSSQHGYIKGKSTQTAIYQFTLHILKFLEENKFSAGIFIDLSKAFDCLNREYLLKKLERYGIVRNALSWLASYLSDRWQCVSVGKDGISGRSGVLESRVGVPQGSILGPILFLIMINDLSCVAGGGDQSAITNFADDTTLLVAGDSHQDLIEKGENLYLCTKEWFLSNNLIINENKTNTMVFRTNTSKEKPLINIDNKTFHTVENTKFLGITINEFLKWTSHIDYLLKKLNNICFALRTIYTYVNDKAKKIIYYANFESLIRYGIIFWGVSSSTQSIFIAQKRAIRLIYNMKPRDSCRGKFKDSGLLTLFGLYLHECLLYLHRNKEQFLSHNTNSTYKTRTLDIVYPIHRLTLTETHPSYMCIKIFNKLPTNLKKIQNYKEFKGKTKRLLTDLEPYNLQDYFDM